MERAFFHIFLTCFDVSADHHALGLVKFLLKRFPHFCFSAYGGEELLRLSHSEKRVNFLGDMATASSIGLLEGFHEFRRSFGFFSRCHRFMKKGDAVFGKVDLFFAIDGQGRNLPLAKKAHRLGIRTAYFFPPNVYVWGSWNIKKMLFFDAVFCAFEVNYRLFKKAGVAAYLVGHPFVYYKKNLHESRALARQSLALPKEQEGIVISLFPGSRFQELGHLALLFFHAAAELQKEFPALRFLCSLAHEDFRELVSEARAEAGFSEASMPLYSGRYDEILLASNFSFLCSGTVTLKAAFFGVPHVACYKISTLSYWLARMLMHVSYISMLNIIADKEISKELINKKLHVSSLLATAKPLLENKVLLGDKFCLGLKKGGFLKRAENLC